MGELTYREILSRLEAIDAKLADFDTRLNEIDNRTEGQTSP